MREVGSVCKRTGTVETISGEFFGVKVEFLIMSIIDPTICLV